MEGDRVELYTSDLAVTADGRVYCATTWEEGHRAAGIYRDGDALTNVLTFGTTAGACVAVNDRWVVYGQNGKLAIGCWYRSTTPRSRSMRSPAWTANPAAIQPR